MLTKVSSQNNTLLARVILALVGFKFVGILDRAIDLQELALMNICGLVTCEEMMEAGRNGSF